jgi:hypothetical protein
LSAGCRRSFVGPSATRASAPTFEVGGRVSRPLLMGTHLAWSVCGRTWTPDGKRKRQASGWHHGACDFARRRLARAHLGHAVQSSSSSVSAWE